MKQLSDCTDEDLVSIAQKIVEKYSKLYSDAKSIADEYGFSLGESQNIILNTVFSSLKEKRDNITKESLESSFKKACEILISRGDFNSVNRLTTLFIGENFKDVRDILDNMNLLEIKSHQNKSATLNSNPKRGRDSRLRVIFSDGTIVEERTAAGTFVKTIERIGENQVANLGLMTRGQELVSQKRYEDGYKQDETKKGWLITTYSGTPEKAKQLQRISDLMGLKLKILVI